MPCVFRTVCSKNFSALPWNNEQLSFKHNNNSKRKETEYGTQTKVGNTKEKWEISEAIYFQLSTSFLHAGVFDLWPYHSTQWEQRGVVRWLQDLVLDEVVMWVGGWVAAVLYYFRGDETRTGLAWLCPLTALSNRCVYLWNAEKCVYFVVAPHSCLASYDSFS
jgi:hypothetical protein